MEKPKKILFFLYECVEVLDFTGPFDVFSMSNIAIDIMSGRKPAGGPCIEPGDHLNLSTISETGGIVKALHGLKIQPDYSFENCPYDEFDLIVIPGSGPTTVVEYINKNPQVIEWLKETATKIETVMSVCVGALFLAKAQLLDGLEATTHHGALQQLEKWAPAAKIHPGARYVDSVSSNPHVLTSAGVSAGMDLSFYVLEHIMLPQVLGPEVECSATTAKAAKIAALTANIMEYNPTYNFATPTPPPAEN